MKKLLLTTFLSATLLLGGAGLSASIANAQTTPCTNCNLGYTPLEPIPGVSQTSSSYDPTNPDNLHNIINAIFTILITGGALMAVLSLTIGGIQYMTSSSAGGKNSGIKRAQAAMWAMLLIAGTWLILHTVNPKLLEFKLTPCQPNAAGCTVVGSSAPNINALPSTNSATSNGTAIGPATLSTATGDQLRTVNSELGLTGGLTGGGAVSDKVLIYDPSNQSAANTAAINAYIDYCENTGIVSKGSLGLIHYNVQPVYGGTFNAPGQNALVCVAN